jgi:hypothetical protein
MSDHLENFPSFSIFNGAARRRDGQSGRASVVVFSFNLVVA